MEYGFNILIAQKLGVNEAIIIRNFQHWITKNKANEKNFCDGRYWTYNSIGAFCKIFPFWSRDQIRYTLKKLTEKGILVSGNYNKNPYDKTLWYSLNEEKLAELLKDDGENFQNADGEIPSSDCENSPVDVGNFPHRSVKFPKPIPYVNTDSKPCENTHTQSVSDGFSAGRSASEHERANSPVERSNPKGFESAKKGCAYPNNSIEANSSEVEEFCKDYKALKNPEFEPSADDKETIAKVLAKNGGYGLQKREYWCEVFKKASRGWKITEKDVTRIVPCPLDRVLTDHSRIKANELGLLPPKKDAPKQQMPSEPEIAEDKAVTYATLQKVKAAVENIRRIKMPIR